eukprot:10838789-Lingulodinium_polyedra.AAC.1
MPSERARASPASVDGTRRRSLAERQAKGETRTTPSPAVGRRSAAKSSQAPWVASAGRPSSCSPGDPMPP